MPAMDDLIAYASANPIAVALTIVTLLLIPLLLKPGKKIALDPGKPVKLKLIQKTIVSHDTRLFKFALQSTEHTLGLPTGQHIQLSFVGEDGKGVSRPYTPVSAGDEKGFVEFMIKVYFPNVHPKFPNGGQMSMHMEGLKVGDEMTFLGPKGRFEYRGGGDLALKKLPSQGGGYEVRKATHIGMIAGGSGVTPMLNIARYIMHHSDDSTKVSLLFANQTEEDILLREELDGLQKDHGNFKVWYTVDKPPAEWGFSSGFINAEMMKEHLPPPGPDTQILVCGPHPMVKFACQPAFDALGYTKDMIIVW